MLLTRALSRADAERIVALLSSKGVPDVGYLRVLAHMASRHGWLKEMRDEGLLTEIQMRVLLEMGLSTISAPGGRQLFVD
ncbi:hypothetical protein BD413DRAFT_571415 [Trametes elegans]|nr:hypothetical protein BD413DRAFT_571415 [Trametes elegans]